MTQTDPSPEAMAAATKYIDKQIANSMKHGGTPPPAMRRELAIWETAKLTDKWIKLAERASGGLR